MRITLTMKFEASGSTVKMTLLCHSHYVSFQNTVFYIPQVEWSGLQSAFEQNTFKRKQVQVCFTRHPFTCFGKINGGCFSYTYLRVLFFVNYGSTEKIMELSVIPERNIVLDH